MATILKSLKKMSVIFVIFPLLIVYGCGGGGSSGGSPALSYTGITTQTPITSGNGTVVTSQAYKQGSTGGNLTGIAMQGGGVDPGIQPKSLVLSQIFIDSFNQVKIPSPSNLLTGAVVSKTDRVTGSCGGTLDRSMSIDDQTGNFTGSATYTNYCSKTGTKAGTVSGTVNISGSYDFNSSRITTLKLSFSSLTVTSGSVSATVSGDFTVNLQSTPVAITFNFLIQNDADKKVYWVQNGTITIATGNGYVDVTMGGRVYLPDYGYVDISTPTPFRVMTNDSYPSSGVLILTGSNNSKARLTALNNTTYQVDLDPAGTGTYVSGQTQNWSSI
ncbi:MAG: hypothetical protein HY036_00395 [Nitrospirae bacterium]|nr:hypothetical protein [Nitrospirota bacterium]MBI3351014.1 hypothetical protein [Nitrospirota bacterium]